MALSGQRRCSFDTDHLLGGTVPFSGTGYVMLAEHTELDEDVFLSPPEA